MTTDTVSTQLRWWKTRIWVGEKADQPIEVYGERFDDLKQNAALWLRENTPLFFGNASSQTNLRKRHNYAYSDGANLVIVVFAQQPSIEKGYRPDGWYHVAGANMWDYPDQMTDFEAVIDHFVNSTMIVERGPDYKPYRKTPDYTLCLQDIKAVRREVDEETVNTLMREGWKIIEIEYKGTQDYTDKMVNRKVVFLLGTTNESMAQKYLDEQK